MSLLNDTGSRIHSQLYCPDMIRNDYNYKAEVRLLNKRRTEYHNLVGRPRISNVIPYSDSLLRISKYYLFGLSS